MRASFLVLCLILFGPLVGVRADERLVILHWNDFHGQVLPRVRSNGAREGGVRELARMVERIRTEVGRDRVLVLDAGDWFQGTPEGNFSGGRMIIDLWNALKIDATVVGNHDFDQGEPNLKRLVARAGFPVLGANVVTAEGTVRDYLEPWTVLEAGGIKIGVLGLLSPRTPTIVDQKIGKDLIVRGAVETCREHLPALRAAGAELIVVLSHLGVGPERELAETVPGIDLILGGHSHTPIFRPFRGPFGTLCGQAGCRGQYLGRIDVRRKTDGAIVSAGRLLPVSEKEGTKASPEVEAILADGRAEIERVMGEVVGQQARALVKSPRRGGNGSSPLGNWLCDVMARRGDASIALHNRGGIRDEIEPGPVKVRTLFQISPFGNEVVVCRMTGADLRTVLERAVADAQVRLEVSGLLVRFRVTPGGEELVEVTLASGDPLEAERVYRVVTNSYLAFGGDGWTQFQRLGEPVSLGTGVFEVTVDEYRRVGDVEPPGDARFRRVEGF